MGDRGWVRRLVGCGKVSYGLTLGEYGVVRLVVRDGQGATGMEGRLAGEGTRLARVDAWSRWIRKRSDLRLAWTGQEWVVV